MSERSHFSCGIESGREIERERLSEIGSGMVPTYVPIHTGDI